MKPFSPNYMVYLCLVLVLPYCQHDADQKVRETTPGANALASMDEPEADRPSPRSAPKAGNGGLSGGKAKKMLVAGGHAIGAPEDFINDLILVYNTALDMFERQKEVDDKFVAKPNTLTTSCALDPTKAAAPAFDEASLLELVALPPKQDSGTADAGDRFVTATKAGFNGGQASFVVLTAGAKPQEATMMMGVAMVKAGLACVLARSQEDHAEPDTLACIPLRGNKPLGNAQALHFSGKGYIQTLTGQESAEGRHGKWTVLQPNGKRKGTYVYDHGALHGRQLVFYDSGNLRAEAEYMHGRPHGVVVEYSDAGHKQSTCNYQDGLAHGNVQRFTPAGVVYAQVPYVQGLIDGVQTTTTRDTKTEAHYRRGHLVGHTIVRDRLNGKILSDRLEGEEVRGASSKHPVHITYAKLTQRFDLASGQKTFEEEVTILPHKSGDTAIAFSKKSTAYYKTGAVQKVLGEACQLPLSLKETQYSLDSAAVVCKPDGPSTGYLASGQVEYSEQYDHGLPTGEHRHYSQAGKLDRIDRYDDSGQLDGVQEAFFDNGGLEHTVAYAAGKPKGQSTDFYPDGRVMRKGTIKPGNADQPLVWVEYIEYYDNGKPKKQCDYNIGRCVQWDVSGTRFDQ